MNSLTVVLAGLIIVLIFGLGVYGRRVLAATDKRSMGLPIGLQNLQPLLRQRYLVLAEPVAFATIELAKRPSLTLNLQSASVRISRQEGLTEAHLSANFPSRWSIADGVILEMSELEVDPFAENCRLVKLSQVPLAQAESVERSRIRLGEDCVYIDDEPVQLIGGDQVLELVLPADYRGDLSVVNGGSGSVVFVDKHSGGDLSLVSECGDYSGAEIDVCNLLVECSDSAAVRFTVVAAADLDVCMEDGNFGADSLTVSGSSRIRFTGSGDLDVPHLKAASATLTLDESSYTNVTLGTVAAPSFVVNNDGQGEIGMEKVDSEQCSLSLGAAAGNLQADSVNAGVFDFSVAGNGDLTVKKLVASISATFRMDDGSYCNLQIDELAGGALDLQSEGSGDMTLPQVQAASFKGVATNGAAFTFGTVTIDGRFEAEQHENGTSRLQSLKAATTSLYCADLGSFEVAYLDTDLALLKSEGDYGIDVEAGRIGSLQAAALSCGDIKVQAEVVNWKVSESDSGTVTIKDRTFD